MIREVAEKGTPFLGICLGLQLLFECSAEAPGVKGLGILKGEILKTPEQKDLRFLIWGGIHCIWKIVEDFFRE